VVCGRSLKLVPEEYVGYHGIEFVAVFVEESVARREANGVPVVDGYLDADSRVPLLTKFRSHGRQLDAYVGLGGDSNGR